MFDCVLFSRIHGFAGDELYRHIGIDPDNLHRLFRHGVWFLSVRRGGTEWRWHYFGQLVRESAVVRRHGIRHNGGERSALLGFRNQHWHQRHSLFERQLEWRDGWYIRGVP